MNEDKIKIRINPASLDDKLYVCGLGSKPIIELSIKKSKRWSDIIKYLLNKWEFAKNLNVELFFLCKGIKSNNFVLTYHSEPVWESWLKFSTYTKQGVNATESISNSIFIYYMFNSCKNGQHIINAPSKTVQIESTKVALLSPNHVLQNNKDSCEKPVLDHSTPKNFVNVNVTGNSSWDEVYVGANHRKSTDDHTLTHNGGMKGIVQIPVQPFLKQLKISVNNVYNTLSRQISMVQTETTRPSQICASGGSHASKSTHQVIVTPCFSPSPCCTSTGLPRDDSNLSLSDSLLDCVLNIAIPSPTKHALPPPHTITPPPRQLDDRAFMPSFPVGSHLSPSAPAVQPLEPSVSDDTRRFLNELDVTDDWDLDLNYSQSPSQSASQSRSPLFRGLHHHPDPSYLVGITPDGRGGDDVEGVLTNEPASATSVHSNHCHPAPSVSMIPSTIAQGRPETVVVVHEPTVSVQSPTLVAKATCTDTAVSLAAAVNIRAADKYPQDALPVETAASGVEGSYERPISVISPSNSRLSPMTTLCQEESRKLSTEIPAPCGGLRGSCSLDPASQHKSAHESPSTLSELYSRKRSRSSGTYDSSTDETDKEIRNSSPDSYYSKGISVHQTPSLIPLCTRADNFELTPSTQRLKLSVGYASTFDTSSLKLDAHLVADTDENDDDMSHSERIQKQGGPKIATAKLTSTPQSSAVGVSAAASSSESWKKICDSSKDFNSGNGMVDPKGILERQRLKFVSMAEVMRHRNSKPHLRRITPIFLVKSLT